MNKTRCSSKYEQVSLFDENAQTKEPSESDCPDAINLMHGDKTKTEKANDTAKRICPTAEYVIHIGFHEFALRPVAYQKTEVVNWTRFKHYLMGDHLFEAVNVDDADG